MNQHVQKGIRGHHVFCIGSTIKSQAKIKSAVVLGIFASSRILHGTCFTVREKQNDGRFH